MSQKKALTVAEKLRIHRRARDAAQKIAEKGFSACVARVR